MQKCDIIDSILCKITSEYDIDSVYNEFVRRNLNSKFEISKNDVKYRIKTLIKNGCVVENGNLLRSNFPAKTALKDKNGKNILKYDFPIDSTNLSDLISKGIDLYTDGIKNNLAKLSNANSAIVEYEVWHNPSYKCNFAKRIFDSYCVNGVFVRSDDAYFAVLRMIDNDNSTQVWQKHRSDFYNIYNYIIANENDFYNRLNGGDITLISDLLSQCTCDFLSFISKICKYLNLWLFNRDDFYIFDYYVLNIIPFYLDHYKTLYPADYISNNIEDLWLQINDRNYEVIFELLTFIHNCRDREFGDRISKDHLDHIMWYCYRNYAQDGKKIPCNLF